MVKTVFHIHTDYSDDSSLSIESILEEAASRGVGCIAVTDHDTLEGAWELAAAGPDLRVVVGQEISTADGHLVGLFLREPVEAGLPVRDTAEAIRQQGGLVITPHPFNRIFGCSLRDKVDEIIDLIDAVEVANGQNLSPVPNRRAAAFAGRHGLPRVVGADTHHRGYLDTCYQWLEPFDDASGFLASLKRAAFVHGPHPLSYFVRSAHVILRYRLGLGAPAGYGRNASNRHLMLAPEPVTLSGK